MVKILPTSTLRQVFTYTAQAGLNFTMGPRLTVNSRSSASTFQVLVWRCAQPCPTFPHLVQCYKAAFFFFFKIICHLDFSVKNNYSVFWQIDGSRLQPPINVKAMLTRDHCS